MRIASVLTAAAMALCERACAQPENMPPLNILHIVVDDLRPELGAYGHPDRHTPAIDSLGDQGVVFDRAYCQYALCGPSRNSFLSGRRPDQSQGWNMKNHFRENHADWTSLPGMFLKAGMNSFGSGKTYHPFLPPNWDGAKSWSTESLPYDNPCWFFGISCLPCMALNGTQVVPKCTKDASNIPGWFHPGSVSTCWCEIPALEDKLTVDHGLYLMDIAAKDFKSNKKQFYLAVGLHKPHLPWQASPEMFAKFPLDNISIASVQTKPASVPDIAFNDADSPSPQQNLPEEEQRLARRAYYASTAGMDEQVGRLLQAMKDKGLENSTVVILHGDHGWQLGERAEWRKFNNFEITTRVPLIIKPPAWFMSEKQAVSRSSSLSELVDLMPTMAEFAQIDLNTVLGEGETKLPGRSLVSALNGTSVKDAAFSQFARKVGDPSQPWKKNGIDHCDKDKFTHMGYSVRTADWRYTEWRVWLGGELKADWSSKGLYAAELYDHRNETVAQMNDFNFAENENVFAAWNGTETQTSLASILRQEFDLSQSREERVYY